jgi:hypothetical protein
MRKTIMKRETVSKTVLYTQGEVYCRILRSRLNVFPISERRNVLTMINALERPSGVKSDSDSFVRVAHRGQGEMATDKLKGRG